MSGAISGVEHGLAFQADKNGIKRNAIADQGAAGDVGVTDDCIGGAVGIEHAFDGLRHDKVVPVGEPPLGAGIARAAGGAIAGRLQGQRPGQFRIMNGDERAGGLGVCGQDRSHEPQQEGKDAGWESRLSGHIKTNCLSVILLTVALLRGQLRTRSRINTGGYSVQLRAREKVQR